MQNHSQNAARSLADRLRMIGQFSLVQLGVQALAAAGGLLVVHALDRDQYASFTLASAVLSAILILSDSGVSTALNAMGGKVWRDPSRLGRLLHAGLRMQRLLALLACGVAIPFLLWMLPRHGTSLAGSFLIAAAVLVAAAFQLPAGALMVVPRLYSQVRRLQKLDWLAAAVRLVLLYAAYRLFLNAPLAIAISAAATALQYAVLKRWVSKDLDLEAPASSEDRREIRRIVQQSAPGAVFYCVQGQLTVWLIGFFGSAGGVAEVGALGRLAIVYAVISAVMGNIVLPHFSRCQSRALLRRRYWQVIGGFALFGSGVLAASAFFPRECLWILGKRYAHLEGELFLMAANTVVASTVGIMWSLNAAKAWVRRVWVEIPLRIALQIALLFGFDLSTVRGVLGFGLCSQLSPFLVNCFLTYQGLWKRGSAENPAASAAPQ